MTALGTWSLLEPINGPEMDEDGHHTYRNQIVEAEDTWEESNA
jgi:hypothetical protein